MVCNYISPNWEPARVQIYANHAGVLETSPSWETSNLLYSFRATFGDADGDGDLDLAVATGESYNAVYQPNYIYYNVGGTLQTTPGWSSTENDACYDAQFVDIDNDGDLDLAFLAGGGPVKIYYSDSDTIATTPGWQSADPDNGNTFDFADVNGDGYVDLGVANNSQLSGSGFFKLYFSAGGTLHTTPDWVSDTSGYGSAAIFADIDSDSDYDFITGRWWDLLHIYINDGGSFAPNPDWTSSPAYESVVENIAFADIDNGTERLVDRTFPGDGQRTLFYLGERHLQGLELVEVDGSAVPPTAYCHHRTCGWISLASAPTESVVVYYRSSRTKDMAVSNWDNATYVFAHDNLTGAPPEDHPPLVVTSAPYAYPNPFNARTTITFELPSPSPVRLEIFDLRGRKLDTVADTYLASGRQALTWYADNRASGLYIFQLQVGAQRSTGKVYLVK
jgi:hypothetical protein